MLRTKVGVLALAGVALTATAACGANAESGAAMAGANGDQASAAASGGTRAGGGTAGERCGTGDLSVSFGEVRDSGTNQPHIQLVYTNVSEDDCTLRGVPGVDLTGPVDPVQGPTYSVPRIDNGDAGHLLKAGEAGIAELTVLADGGPEAWVPTELITIPPGEDTARRIAWPYDFGVLRQDGATHPGTYVNGFGAE